MYISIKKSNRDNGYMLIEVLIGICLLGIIFITFIPAIGMLNINILKLQNKSKLKCVGENCIEVIKSFNFKNQNTNYLMDMKVNDIVNLFCENNELNLSLPDNSKKNIWKYNVNIHKTNINECLWLLNVTVNLNNDQIKSVHLKAYVSNPKCKWEENLNEK